MKFYSTLFVFFTIVALSSAVPANPLVPAGNGTTDGTDNVKVQDETTADNVQNKAPDGGEHAQPQTHPEAKPATPGQKATHAGDAADKLSTPDGSGHVKTPTIKDTPKTEVADAAKTRWLTSLKEGVARHKFGLSVGGALLGGAALGAGVAFGGKAVYNHWKHPENTGDKEDSLKESVSEASIDDEEDLVDDNVGSIDREAPSHQGRGQQVDGEEQLDNEMPARKSTNFNEEQLENEMPDRKSTTFDEEDLTPARKFDDEFIPTEDSSRDFNQ